MTLWPATLATASVRAEKTDIASISGGSPTALERWMVASRFSPRCQSATLKASGRSPAAGILYVDGAWVLKRPFSSNTSSSVVSQPMPWMKPPSTWPRSTAGFRERPASCRMSTRVTRFSPVRVSMTTSEQAAP